MKLDNDEFTKIFAHYRAPVYRQVLRMTRSRWHAEEIVQEVFLRVWLHREKWINIHTPEAWFQTVTRHLVYDYLIKYTRQKKHLSLSPRTSVMTHQQDDRLYDHCLRLIGKGSKGLPPRQREAFHLKYVLGYEGGRIAKEMGISEATARNHVKAGARWMRAFVVERLAV